MTYHKLITILKIKYEDSFIPTRIGQEMDRQKTNIQSSPSQNRTLSTLSYSSGKSYT